VTDRAAYVDLWLACRESGGGDADNDGFDFCRECDDREASVHPGAAEQCNGRDDDCNGRIDDGVVCE
jgi:hypothetical protein